MIESCAIWRRIFHTARPCDMKGSMLKREGHKTHLPEASLPGLKENGKLCDRWCGDEIRAMADFPQSEMLPLLKRIAKAVNSTLRIEFIPDKHLSR